MGSLCSWSTSSSTTFHLWGVILSSICINTQSYLPSSKIQPFSGFTFNSFPGSPSPAILHPRWWKPASCSAGLKDLNHNFWHSVQNAGRGFLLFGLLWVSGWSTVCCSVMIIVSCILKILHSFPNDSLLCLACIIHQNAGREACLAHLASLQHSVGEKWFSLTTTSFCWDRSAPVFF